jgi:hypothetical protein
VVLNNPTDSTNQVLEPDGDVSSAGSERAILSPISNGLLTKTKRIPSKNLLLADPNMNENEKKKVAIDVMDFHSKPRINSTTIVPMK